jgi:hypothetical protein
MTPAEQQGFIELLSGAGTPPLQTPSHLENIAADLDLTNIDSAERELLNNIYQTGLQIKKEAVPTLMLLSKKWTPENKATLRHTKIAEAQATLRQVLEEHVPADKAQALSLEVRNQALHADDEALVKSLNFFIDLPEALKAIVRLFIQNPDSLYAEKQEVWRLAPGKHGNISGYVLAFRPFSNPPVSPEVFSTLRVLEDIYFDWFTEPMEMKRLFDRLYAKTLNGLPAANAPLFFPFDDLPGYLKKSRDLYKQLLTLANPFNDYEQPVATHIPQDALANFLLRKSAVDAILSKKLES